MKPLTKKVVNDKLHYLYTNVKSKVRFARKDLLYKELIKVLKKQGYVLNSSMLKRWLNEWMTLQNPHVLHKPIKRKFKRAPVIVGGVGHQLQMDLLNLQHQADDNQLLFKWPGHSKAVKRPMKYVLAIIDVFSKKAWTYPLPNKEGVILRHTLETFFKRYKKEEKDTNGGRTVPRRVQTDKGTEFLNREVQQLFKNLGIHFFQTDNPETKASVVERLNRTLMSYVHKYYTYLYQQKKLREEKKGDWRLPRRWVDVMDSIVDNYNNRFHSSIGMAPNEVNYNNEIEVISYMNGHQCSQPKDKLEKSKFKKGDKVLMNIYSSRFRKGYAQQWRDEICIIDKVILKNQQYLYKLKDLDEEPIRGLFYKDELQKAPEKFFLSGKKWRPTSYGTL